MCKVKLGFLSDPTKHNYSNGDIPSIGVKSIDEYGDCYEWATMVNTLNEDYDQEYIVNNVYILNNSYVSDLFMFIQKGKNICNFINLSQIMLECSFCKGEENELDIIKLIKKKSNCNVGKLCSIDPENSAATVKCKGEKKKLIIHSNAENCFYGTKKFIELKLTQFSELCLKDIFAIYCGEYLLGLIPIFDSRNCFGMNNNSFVKRNYYKQKQLIPQMK